MAIKTPTINGIIRMTEFDLLRTKIRQGYMYMCLDSLNLYYDETDSRRVRYTYTSIKTANDLFYNITPSSGTTYYCWEDNSLWLWMNKWISLWTDSTYPAAYNYESISPTSANPSSLNSIYYNDDPNTPIDTNGLLKDGSVIIRDRNRIIKGKIYIEDSNDNLTISSFLGGGIRFLPNGKMDTDGELLIGDDGKSIFRTELHLLNNEAYIDYSEDPDSDPSDYPNDKHIYEIFHSGNLDVSAIKVLNPSDIYNKLLDDSLPNPLEFNVKYLNGKTSDEFALLKHSHIATDITDFNDKSRTQAEVKIKEIFNNMIGEGIYISYISSSSTFKMSANSFNITFDGGVSGTAVVSHLGDTTAELTVNPARHVHQNYIDTMNNLQDQIDNISSVDPTNYYNKQQTDEKLALVTGTPNPEVGKPLLVNNDLKLPGTALSADKLSSDILLKFTGDLTAITSTNFSSDIEINLDTSNIISNIAEVGKAVKVNSEGNLPVNSTSASKLNHEIMISLEGEVNGQAELDTSLDNIVINTTLVPGDNILQSKDLGTKVASLDESGRVPKSQLPVSQAGLVPQGYWNPETGAPSTEPAEGQFWIASTEGIFEDKLYKINDWCLYYNSAWNNINTNDNVISVNSKTGVVELTNDDVNAISKNYINYTVGDIIPQNKLVLTSQDGIIEGASVTKLANSFGLVMEDGSEIDITDDSENSTNGSKNISLKFSLNDIALNKIFEKTGHTILTNSIEVPYQNKINFVNGFKVTPKEDAIEISLSTGDSSIAFVYWNGNQDDEFLSELVILYKNRKNVPIILVTQYDQNTFYYLINESYPDIEATTTINIKPDHFIIGVDDTNISNISITRKVDNLGITFSKNEDDLYIDEININPEVEVIYKTLTTQGEETTEAYLPVFDSNPATKKYVDNKISFYGKFSTDIGDGVNTSFTIKHNLGTDDVLVTIRDNLTRQQIYASNTIIDENTVRIDLNTIIEQDYLNVTITKL